MGMSVRSGHGVVLLLWALVNLPCFYCEPTLDVVPRAEWGARIPKERVPTAPALLVVIHHTYKPGACNSRENCSQAMREIQDFHMDTRGWSDFAYNFAIGGDDVYEGRGWQIMGAHTKGYNNNSLGIVFIGDYRDVLPTYDMLMMCKALIQLGIDNNHIGPNYQLAGHRQLVDTECPGNALYGVIKTWSHWVPHPLQENGAGELAFKKCLLKLNVIALITTLILCV